jgi:GDP-L-fucose synthase
MNNLTNSEILRGASDFSLAGKRVFVAGHLGMVGSALVRRLKNEDCEILTVERALLDLRRQSDVEAWFSANAPDVVFLTAAKVGGIKANAARPAEFLYDNIAIEANIINAAAQAGVTKLMMLGAGCLYPRTASQPISEDSLLTGLPEPTNEWYTIAKIAGVKLCQAYRAQYGHNFISVVPASLYGPGDNFDADTGHVIAALLQRTHLAKITQANELVVWGTGKALREFMYVDDCADALVFLMRTYSDHNPINIGTGREISIRELAIKIAAVVGYTEKLSFDASKPEGAPRKLLDSTRIMRMGWHPPTSLDEGLARTYGWLQEHRLCTSQNETHPL